MRRIRSFFQSLAWKLTLSYTAVTVAALLVVEIIVIAIALIFVLNSRFLPQLAAQVMVNSASQASPFLEGPSPDLNGLNSWLQRAAMSGFESTGQSGQTMSFSPGSLPNGASTMAVIDTQGNVLAMFPSANPSQVIGKPFQASPEMNQLIDRALSGVTDYHDLYTYTPSKVMLIAAPIRDPSHKLLGVLLLEGAVVSPDQPYTQLLSALGVSLLIFTLAAGAVGTIFGFITARGLSRRLRTVSEAADSWSRGDFSAFVKDTSGDELGQLARRLNRMAEQLQNLMQTRQELATLEERNRLARDLHDSVKQQVFAASMQVGAARALLDQKPAAAREHLDEAEQLARQAQAELTSLIRELRPVTLENRGLAQALRDYTDTWSRQNNIQIEFNLRGERALPLELEQSLFRVAQEALANVARHSRATHVQVHLAWQELEVTLTVSDNGRGFDPATASGKGLGLQSMQERIQALGGRLELHSAPGKGTQVAATLPVSMKQVNGTKS